MGRETGIAWCHHTFNPWWGCVKISPACTNCYAESLDARWGGDHWGPNTERKIASERYWKSPLAWDRAAERDGVRRRVFCASMSDVFEDRRDLDEHRRRLWRLIEDTPNLDWLLLTKRPQNIATMLPVPLIKSPTTLVPFFRNVWLGTTVENQEYADERIATLLANPAVVHFISAEPLLGELDLAPWVGPIDDPETGAPLQSLAWVITGSESGRGARPQNVDWFRSLRDQCEAAGIAFLFKQANPERGDVDVPIDAIKSGPGSYSGFGTMIELPYLDGVQHAAFPTVLR